MRIFGLIDRKNGVGMKAYLVTVATQLYTRFTISCLFSLPKTLCVENERAFGFLSDKRMFLFSFAAKQVRAKVPVKARRA